MTAPASIPSSEMQLEVVEFFVSHAGPDLGNEGFCGEGEVGLHHPVVIGGFVREDLFEGLAFVLTEVEDFAPLGIEGDMSDEVGPLAGTAETAELLDVVHHGLADGAVGGGVLGILVAVQLGHEHFVGGQGVSIGTVGVFQFLVAVETVGGLQGALLHLVEDVLHVNQAAAFEVEGNPGPKEFLHQQGHIEFIGVVARQVGIANKGGNLLGQLGEGGLVGHVGIGYAMYGGGKLGDVDGLTLGVDRADAVDAGFGGASGQDFVKADFNDMVVTYIDACGFEVEEYDRFF